MIDYIIPLPPGTMSGGKAADGLIACPNDCGEVAVVRLMKTGEIAAYCDGKITVRKCGARQFSGSIRDFPRRDKETALKRAFDLGLSDAPPEYIDLFEKSWGASLTKTYEVQGHESTLPENPENPPKSATSESGKSGTLPENPAGNSEPESGNSGISGSTDDDIYNALYGG